MSFGQLFASLAGLASQRKILVLLALTAIAYWAAINRGQPFFWLMPALLMAILLTGFAWPRWLVRCLTVTRQGPSRAEEGQRIEFAIVVDNPGWLPRFMIEIVDQLPFVEAKDGSKAAGRHRLGLLAYLPGRSRQQFAVSIVCEKRGFYRLGPVGLASSFPLGLTEARASRQGGVHSLTIYPEIFPVLALPLHGAPSQIHRGGYLLPEGAGAAEFSGLREYRRGDNPRHVHWPTTARLNELMVREYEPLASACLFLLLDQSAAANLGRGRQAIFEYAVRIAASMARFACSANLRLRLAGAGQTWLHTPAGSGEGHFQATLDELAVVDCDGDTPYAVLLNEVGPHCLRGETVVLFLAVPDADWPATLQAIATLRARQVHVLAVLFERASFDPSAKAGRGADLPARQAALVDLGAECVRVRQGDDLMRLFNR